MKAFKNPLMYLSALAFSATAFAEEAGAAEAAHAIPLTWWIAPASSILALVFAVYFYKKVLELFHNDHKQTLLRVYN